jgi:hypothetical protein
MVDTGAARRYSSTSTSTGSGLVDGTLGAKVHVKQSIVQILLMVTIFRTSSSAAAVAVHGVKSSTLTIAIGWTSHGVAIPLLYRSGLGELRTGKSPFTRFRKWH